jgi:N6-adenosine-specific RNA methylase IME4
MARTLTYTQDKQARRAARESALAAKQLALPDRRYGVIVADPPWRFEPYSRETGMDRAADNHYPTQSIGDIATLPVPSIAAKDCVLFLWVTVPFLEQSFAVMKAWGFTYKSSYVWVKLGKPPSPRPGMSGSRPAMPGPARALSPATGYWNKGAHELLLIGTRGSVPAPAPGTQWVSVIEAAKGAHSVKPPKVLEMIECYYPHMPKIELHRRGPARAGWDAWGNEVIGIIPQ